MRNRSAILDATCAVVGAGAAFNYCQFTSIKKSQNFFQMRFIENLSFALKKRVQKIFFKGCGLGQVLEWHIELPHLAKKTAH